MALRKIFLGEEKREISQLQTAGSSQEQRCMGWHLVVRSGLQRTTPDATLVGNNMGVVYNLGLYCLTH